MDQIFPSTIVSCANHGCNKVGQEGGMRNRGSTWTNVYWKWYCSAKCSHQAAAAEREAAAAEVKAKREQDAARKAASDAEAKQNEVEANQQTAADAEKPAPAPAPVVEEIAKLQKELSFRQGQTAHLQTQWEEARSQLEQAREQVKQLERARQQDTSLYVKVAVRTRAGAAVPEFKSSSLMLVESPVASGGFADIYFGFLHGRIPIAAKKPRVPVNIPSTDRADFENEVRIMGAVDHPHCATIFGQCTEPGKMMIVM